MRLLVNTQTPLIRFNLSYDALIKKYGKLQDPLDLSQLKEGEDYIVSPGGVTRMIYPLLLRLREHSPHWVSLNPNAPPRIVVNNIVIHNLDIPRSRLRGYGYVKETIWRLFHRLIDMINVGDVVWSDDYVDYLYYNRRVAEFIRGLDFREDFDLVYIHDFQQLPVGQMLGGIKPRAFRWHIPLDFIPQDWTALMSTYLNGYDVIIVSTRRYAETVRKLGYRGRVEHIYPYVDPSQYIRPSRSDIEKFSDRFNISRDDYVILVVARMDPMKGQDRVIKALPRIRSNVKLILVGDGSFSSSRTGLGLSKGEEWASHLKALSRELGVEDRVIFVGYASPTELAAAYSRADVVVLPSIAEGFGLVVIEAWIYGKPVVVSNKAGVAEIIRNGHNGLIIDPDDPEGIAWSIERVLHDEDLASELARNGASTMYSCCTIDVGIKAEVNLFKEIIEE